MDKHIKWKEYFKLLDYLAKCIDQDKTDSWQVNWNLIYGIPRGGLIPATYLSYKLNIPLIVTPINNLKEDEFLLIVDDILDSGKTAIKTVKTFLDLGIDEGRIWLLPLYRKYSGCKLINETSFRVNIYVHGGANIIDDNCWVHFPYEEKCLVKDTVSVVKQPGT
jgi:hypoxanthine phosphoribosyltransferase